MHGSELSLRSRINERGSRVETHLHPLPSAEQPPPSHQYQCKVAKTPGISCYIFKLEIYHRIYCPIQSQSSRSRQRSTNDLLCDSLLGAPCQRAGRSLDRPTRVLEYRRSHIPDRPARCKEADTDDLLNPGSVPACFCLNSTWRLLSAELSARRSNTGGYMQNGGPAGEQVRRDTGRGVHCKIFALVWGEGDLGRV